MDYAYRMYKNVRYYYEQINPATLSGQYFYQFLKENSNHLKSVLYCSISLRCNIFMVLDNYTLLQQFDAGVDDIIEESL